ncbi:hypothetical protein DPEC_G00167520 [Dallia pectoralis]|uniref:Uncharacterized protein n=1 Tax=Dallia pectoralis TaxID=75939 RepID=A0ACC2GIA1_DALPE|nr:hypothetical protein DPEC_G00167520 [Dallia pectoralis]
MCRTEELCDFKHGTVIECHLCNKSICESVNPTRLELATSNSYPPGGITRNHSLPERSSMSKTKGKSLALY